jgi:hypothetical protein
MRARLTVLLAVVTGLSLGAQAPGPHGQHANAAMGFDQEKTTHHFYLYADGGAVDVSVKDPADKQNLDAIRAHLPHIAQLFAQGNFETPMLVHQRNVPGTDAMAQARTRIAYAYKETPRGGRVEITTTDAKALDAVHTFLKFQITDHKTGDPLTVTKR